MAIKINLEKAFDRIEWSLIRDTLNFFGIPNNLSKLIMSCITANSIQILVNGRPADAFYPSRGIRQGDPMSPYIFIMCIERLSRTINQLTASKDWNPIKISTKGPTLSHLFFDDDLALFAKVDAKNCNIIVNTLHAFWVTSGQKVNRAKSSIFFSRNCRGRTKEECSTILGIEGKSTFGKYLGFPIFHKKPRNSDFQYLVDNMRQRLTG